MEFLFVNAKVILSRMKNFIKPDHLILSFCFAFCFSFSAVSQDIHFSQFYVSPLFINPAMAGFGETEYRVNSQYRNQWTGFAHPYSTMQASGDMNFLKEIWKKGFPSMGISFYSDKAGKSNMGITEVQLSLCYTVHLDDVNELSSGLQAAFVQRSIDASNLKWDNQFNGNAYDPSLPSGESMLAEPFTYFDLAAGFLWAYHPDDDFKIHAGLAGFHLNVPPQSFYGGTADRLNLRFVLHSGSEIRITEKRLFLVPKLLAMNQGGSFELTAGSLVKYMVGLESRYTGAYSASAVSFGALYRFGDALSIQGYYDHKNSMSFGLSYDLNVSAFRAATRTLGGVEVSLAYKGDVFREKGWRRR
jgi:type IX secretion system PorP/SprF family membrane protein